MTPCAWMCIYDFNLTWTSCASAMNTGEGNLNSDHEIECHEDCNPQWKGTTEVVSLYYIPSSILLFCGYDIT